MSEYVTTELHEEFAKRIEEENTRQNHRIAKLEEAFCQFGELVTSVKVLAVNVESIAKEINEQGIRLKEIEGKPAKRWETIIGCVLTALVTAAVSYFLTR